MSCTLITFPDLPEHGPVKVYVPKDRVAGTATPQTVAALRLRKMQAAGLIHKHPERKYLFNMYYSMLRRALTDSEAARIVTLTEATSKELK